MHKGNKKKPDLAIMIAVGVPKNKKKDKNMTYEEAEKIVKDKNKFDNYTPQEIKKARNIMMQDVTGPLLEEDMVNVGGKFISPPKPKPKKSSVPKPKSKPKTPPVPKSKPKMMGGGMAYGKKHMYVAGGSVQSNLKKK
jgi:hypothetical protein